MTLRERLHRVYANLAMAHAAVNAGRERYGQVDFIIRSRLEAGLAKGTMNVRSLMDDARFQLTQERGCAYCGVDGPLTIDHLIPRDRGGPESADNAVHACRSCNSSKGNRDVLTWLAGQGRFPPLMILRRYLKLALLHCEIAGLLDLEESAAPALPFDLASLPAKFPQPAELVLWTPPRG